MKRMVWVAGLLAALIVVLAPIAWASSIDPTWGKGMYDDADFDDVIADLTSGMTGILDLPVVEVASVTAFLDVNPLSHDVFPAVAPPSFAPRSAARLALRRCNGALVGGTSPPEPSRAGPRGDVVVSTQRQDFI